MASDPKIGNTPPPAPAAAASLSAEQIALGAIPAGEPMTLMDDSSLILESDRQADTQKPGQKDKNKAQIDPPRKKVNILEMRAMAFQMQFDSASLQLETSKQMMDSMTAISQRSAEDQLRKINEQVEKQKQSEQKTGFLGVLGTIFNILTVVVAVALIATGVGAGFGMGLLVGFALGKVLEIDAVKNLIVKAASAVFGEKIGSVIANVVIIGVQLAIAIKSGNIGKVIAQKPGVVFKAIQKAVSKIVPALKNAEKTATGLEKANSYIQVTGGAMKGTTAGAIGVTNYQLSGLKEEVGNITADISFLQGLTEQLMVSQQRQMNQMNQDLKTALQNIQSSSDIVKYPIS